MKHLTRFFALVLALTLALSLSMPAFALGAQRPDPEKPFDNSAFFDYKDYRIHYRTFPAENEKGQIFMIHGFALSSYCFVMLAEKTGGRRLHLRAGRSARFRLFVKGNQRHRKTSA